jgi:hypothetical protein
MKQEKNVDSLLARLNEAEQQKDWGEMASILDDATEGDVGVLRSVIPRLAAHQNWLIRASAMELIGDFRLRSFMNLVEVGLEDKHPSVKSYALMAYYDLLKKKALPTIERFERAADIGLRVTALALHYVERSDEHTFRTLEGILSRKRCSSTHRYAVINVFDHYSEVKSHKEMVELFESILQDVPASDGLASEITKKLNKWRGGSGRG